ncbi:MAG: carbohydrate kinase family protein [Ruminococcus sp.]|nr:carbohydrate kinase family protein [Ruminococcus sp.]
MKRVEVIGAAIVDVMVSPAEEEVFQTGSYAAEKIVMTHGGDALNEATVLQCLGVPVHLETVIGNDTAGETICRHMENAGLEESGLHIKNDMNTSINVVLVKENGERCFLTNPYGSQRKLKLDDITMPFPKEINILCFASIFVFPELKTEEMKKIFAQARSQGITVCADMTKCKNQETVDDIAPALEYVDYLFPNKEEAMLVTRTTTVEDAAESLLNAGVGTVVIKCGAEGCFVKTKEKAFYAPAVKGVKCVDTTGAGDSFVGGFVYGLANDFSLEKCAEFANECGAKAIEKVGAITWLV